MISEIMMVYKANQENVMKLTTHLFIMNHNYLVSNLVVGDMVRFTNPLSTPFCIIVLISLLEARDI